MAKNTVVAVTGGFCTGKSLVLNMFGKLGAKIIDVDKFAHEALEPDTPAFKKIIREFGHDILTGNRIDRKALAKKVFGNKLKVKKLNTIVHPIVIKKMNIILDKVTNKKKVIAVEVPLLFEAHLAKYFDYILVVKTDKNTQIKRAFKKWKIEKIDILRRINSQLPLAKKIKQADFVIDNNNSKDKTFKQLKNCWQTITS